MSENFKSSLMWVHHWTKINRKSRLVIPVLSCSTSQRYLANPHSIQKNADFLLLELSFFHLEFYECPNKKPGLNNKRHPMRHEYWNSGENRRYPVVKYGSPFLVTDIECTRTNESYAFCICLCFRLGIRVGYYYKAEKIAKTIWKVQKAQRH